MHLASISEKKLRSCQRGYWMTPNEKCLKYVGIEKIKVHYEPTFVRASNIFAASPVTLSWYLRE